MDDRTFDRLVTILTAPQGRRDALTALRAGVLAIVLARGASAGEAMAKRKQHDRRRRKDRRQKRTGHQTTLERQEQPTAAVAAGCQPVGSLCDQDPDCCAGAECRLFTCQCVPGLTRCGGQCIDRDTAHDHCGACNHACGANAICIDGSCIPCPDGNTRCGDICCSPYRVCCDGTCVDALYTNPDHCGACGNRCPGACIRNPDGSLDCFGRCCSEGQCVSNFQTDRKNCGACGHACRAGESCCGGECLDLDTDGSNCGRCGRSCQQGKVCCEGSCVNLTSEEHCGACGNECPGEYWTCCGGTCISDRLDFCCRDEVIPRYNFDIFNCGGCGVVCPPGAKCCFGECCPIVYECGWPGAGCQPPS